MQSAAAFAEASGSDAAWKALALRLAEEAQTCIDNAHWEVKFGSGDMLKTIKAIRLMKEVEAAEHLNDQAHPTAAEREVERKKDSQ